MSTADHYARSTVGWGTRISQFLFLACAAGLLVYTADGLSQFMKAKQFTGWDWLSTEAMAAAVAVLIVTFFSLLLIQWHNRKTFGGFVYALAILIVSLILSMNFWFRMMRGEAKTSEIFVLQRDAVVKQLTVALDRVQAAVNGMTSLAAESRQKAKDEAAHGNTCERQTKKIAGQRSWFRKADAEMFEGLAAGVKDVPAMLRTKIDDIRALNPRPGETLAEDLGRLRAAATAAMSIQRDPALVQAQEKLRARVADDGKVQGTGKTAFSCPDQSIRNQAETTFRRLEDLGKVVIPAIEVPDMTDITESLKIFGELFRPHQWGQPGGLSISDAAIFLLAIVFELIMTRTAGSFAYLLAHDSAIDRLPREIDRDPRLALAIVRAFGGEPDAALQGLMATIEQHEMRLFGYRRLVVLYGSEDEASRKLAWNAEIMRDLGMIEEDSFLLASLRLPAAFALWRQDRSYDRIEIFRERDRGFHKIRSREFIARVREHLAVKHPPASPLQDNAPWLEAAE